MALTNDKSLFSSVLLTLNCYCWIQECLLQNFL